MLLLLHCDRTQHRIGGHAVVQLPRMHVSRPSVRSFLCPLSEEIG